MSSLGNRKFMFSFKCGNFNFSAVAYHAGKKFSKARQYSINSDRIKIAQRIINLAHSGHQRKVFVTDDFGGFDLNFLALQDKDTFFPAARKITFLLASDGNSELKRLILTRDYLSKLLWARTKINAYKMSPSGKKLFETVIYLEKTGFEILAYALEESELARKAADRKFQADFKSAAAQQ